MKETYAGWDAVHFKGEDGKPLCGIQGEHKDFSLVEYMAGHRIQRRSVGSAVSASIEQTQDRFFEPGKIILADMIDFTELVDDYCPTCDSIYYDNKRTKQLKQNIAQEQRSN